MECNSSELIVRKKTNKLIDRNQLLPMLSYRIHRGVPRRSILASQRQQLSFRSLFHHGTVQSFKHAYVTEQFSDNSSIILKCNGALFLLFFFHTTVEYHVIVCHSTAHGEEACHRKCNVLSRTLGWWVTEYSVPVYTKKMISLR